MKAIHFRMFLSLLLLGIISGTNANGSTPKAISAPNTRIEKPNISKLDTYDIEILRPIDRIEYIFDLMLLQSKSTWIEHKKKSSLNSGITELIAKELQGKDIEQLYIADFVDAVINIINEHYDQIASDLARHNLSLEQFTQDLLVMKEIKSIWELKSKKDILSRYSVIMSKELAQLFPIKLGWNFVSWA